MIYHLMRHVAFINISRYGLDGPHLPSNDGSEVPYFTAVEDCSDSMMWFR